MFTEETWKFEKQKASNKLGPTNLPTAAKPHTKLEWGMQYSPDQFGGHDLLLE
jgi:hypothetical protein